ncbi:hypothetical protein DFH06DRAFT_726875 [Mycena polygramma]|nr:hypothetical protein DFH06DRAFT_726875 [Mycena polygramma]
MAHKSRMYQQRRIRARMMNVLLVLSGSVLMSWEPGAKTRLQGLREHLKPSDRKSRSSITRLPFGTPTRPSQTNTTKSLTTSTALIWIQRLIFAGLFSAVSSAFIIQIQPELQPDPTDMTHALLRLLIHNVNGTVFPDSDVIPQWTGPPTVVVAVQCLLYGSLASTLLAALLAVLGKQWLMYYGGAGERGSIEQRCLERQRKFDGMRRWGFDPVMQLFPLLLQFSLLLFAAALAVYLWTVHHSVAAVVLTLSALGVGGGGGCTHSWEFLQSYRPTPRTGLPSPITGWRDSRQSASFFARFWQPPLTSFAMAGTWVSREKTPSTWTISRNLCLCSERVTSRRILHRRFLRFYGFCRLLPIHN